MESSLREKIRMLAEERLRLEQQEALLIEEAKKELTFVSAELKKLEERRSELELIIGVDDGEGRAEHGQIQRLCLGALSGGNGGLTSGEVRDELERKNPGLRLTSVPSTLSRLMSNGRIRRDEMGRYFLS